MKAYVAAQLLQTCQGVMTYREAEQIVIDLQGVHGPEAARAKVIATSVVDDWIAGVEPTPYF